MTTRVTMTNRGVITLPAKLRRELGLREVTQFLVETTAEGLLLRPAVTLPVELYSADRVKEFDAAEMGLERVLQEKPPAGV